MFSYTLKKDILKRLYLGKIKRYRVILKLKSCAPLRDKVFIN